MHQVKIVEEAALPEEQPWALVRIGAGETVLFIKRSAAATLAYGPIAGLFANASPAAWAARA